MQQPHAVVVLPNNIQIDARAHRNAMALAAAGYRVTIVGFGTGMPERGQIAGIDYVLCRALPAPTPGAAAAPSGSQKLSFTYRAVRKAFHVTMHRRPPTRVLKAVARFDETTGAIAQGARGVVTKARTAAAPKPPELPVEDGPIQWEEALPHVTVMTRSLLPAVLELRPDVLIPDVHLLPLCVEVRKRLLPSGHDVGIVYDAREYVYGLASDDPKITQGFPALETEFMPDVDAAVTVCEPIARFLQETYDLPGEPPLVPNAPIGHLPPNEHPMTIRDLLPIDDDVPLLVYAGGLSHHRGVHDVVSALPDLPGVHLALGARAASSYTLELEKLAKHLGVSDRLHFVPYAPGHEVADYLASATAAIFPFLPVGNHNWAAPNKYYEAVQARLPILTSNMEWLSERITRLGIGEVFEHSNPASVVEAARKVLGNLDTYRAKLTDEVVEDHMFERFSGTMVDVVKGATVPRLLKGLRPEPFEDQVQGIRADGLRQRPQLADSELFTERPWLRIGNANSGGQPQLWATALMREHPTAVAESVWLYRDSPLVFPVGETIAQAQWVSPAWQKHLVRKLENRVSHVLSESGRPVVGARFGNYFYDEARFFADAGIGHALVFHGSDIRNPRLHAALEPASPYADHDDELTSILQRQVDALTPHVKAFAGPVYVTTNDLLDHLPGATWLPVVVDTDLWTSDIVPLERDAPPIVFHVPSKKNAVKGSHAIDDACLRLQSEGRIRYFRADGLTHEQMREKMMDADIVIDQLRLGDYGITAVEGMSGGKIVIGHVADRVRDRIGEPVPIVEATGETIGAVLADLLAHPERASQLSAEGRAYAVKHHDGRHSARVLAEFMGLPA